MGYERPGIGTLPPVASRRLTTTGRDLHAARQPTMRPVTDVSTSAPAAPSPGSRARARPRPLARALRDGAVVAGLLFAAYLFAVVAPQVRTFGFDAYAYWSLNPSNPYAVTAGGLGAFTYTPVMVRVFSPVSALAWPTFLWLWTAVLVATVIWLGWGGWLAALRFPPVPPGWDTANPHPR